MKNGDIKPSERSTFVSSVKNMPSDIKTEILKPSSEGDRSRINNIQVFHSTYYPMFLTINCGHFSKR
ncbi:MAG: hypothetical protein GF311_13160 [Candidatus Lokiarchaeota archaeon]|nr:hypothetical protein [Candidatus Lokiarchaeota archaeon]